MNNKSIIKQRVLAFAKLPRARIQPALLSLVAMMVIAVVTLGCGWSFFTEHSVRFKAHNDEREFYRLPPLPDLVDPKTGQWRSIYDAYQGTGPDPATDQLLQPENFWEQAEAAEQQGAWAKAQTLLGAFLDAATKEYATVELRQKQINSAQDRLAAMTALRQGTRERDVQDYLSLRREFDKAMDPSLRIEKVTRPSLTSSLSFIAPTNFIALIESSQNTSSIVTDVQSAIPTNVQELLYLDTLDKTTTARAPRNLQDNYAYLKAALLYRLERFDEAKAVFQEIIRKYPNSERREAAMYMVSVVAMKIFNQNVIPDCGAGIGDTQEDRSLRRENCQDEKWQAALLAMNQLIHEYPHGKFVYATYENRAYWLRRGGELALGAADYYRMLGHPSDVQVRLQGKQALRLLGEDFGTDAILNEIEAELAQEPQAALAYAYHRIYNHAVDYNYAVPYHWDNDHYQEKLDEEERVQASLNKAHAELQRIANFATAMMRRYPLAGINGAFMLRMAQAQIELQNFREAVPLATKALSLNIKSDLRAEALWIKGSAEHKLRNYSSARATLTRLVHEFPKSHLSEGAQRLLAMAAEDAGDLEGALEYYIALNYKYDIAYFLDVLLTPEQVARFLDRHPKLAHRDLYEYSLGLRYLRDGNWKQAQTQFAKIRAVNCNIGSHNWYGNAKGSNPKWDYESFKAQNSVCSEWVLSDLKTTYDLERLEGAIALAQGDEAKAEAMYQFASYQFENSQLLFYNPAIWGGVRYPLLCDFDEMGNYRAPNEAKVLYEYMKSHENLSHAIPTYLELARLYPNTRAAKDGLYTAVVAHRRLANYNNYWRRLYQNGLPAGERWVTFREIRSLYPTYQMPRAEYGWEPTTRTVNGGPGWAPPPPKPKPVPKPTRAQRVKRMLKHVVADLHSRLQDKADTIEKRYASLLERCLAVLLWIAGALGLWYGAVLGLHFWKQRLMVPEPELTGLFASDLPPKTLPDTESRVEKVIGRDS